MDIKQIIRMGGAVELTGLLLVLLRASDVDPETDSPDGFLPVLINTGAELKIEKQDGNLIAGVLVSPGRAVILGGDSSEIQGLEGLEFISAIKDIEQAIYFSERKEA